MLFALCWFAEQVAAQATVKANLTYYKGISSLKRGKMSSALRLFKQVLRENPKHSAACLAIIKLQLAAGREQKAARMLAALYQSSNNNGALPLERDYYLAHLHILTQDYPSARKHLEGLVSKAYDVERPDFSILARCYNALGYLNVLQSPNQAKEGYLFSSENVLQRSRVMFEEALKYNVQNTSAFSNYTTMNDLLGIAPNFIQPYVQQDFVAKGGDTFSENSSNVTSSYKQELLPDETRPLIEHAQLYDELLLMIDVSGSMRSPLKKSGTATRFDIMQTLAAYILDKTNSKVRIGAVSVGGSCGGAPVLRRKVEKDNRAALTRAIQTVPVDGHTPVNDALLLVPELFKSKRAKKGIILITDGMESCHPGETCELAAWLGTEGITLHVLSFLEEKAYPEEYASYTCMAATTGGTLSSVSQSDKIEAFDYQFIHEEQLILPPLKIDTSLNVKTLVAEL
ncbi:MAG: VWA domain-containing protein [Bacteroidota bacterium]